jgi:hypothetical protein
VADETLSGSFPVVVLILAALYCHNIHSSIYDAVSVKEQAMKGQTEVDI